MSNCEKEMVMKNRTHMEGFYHFEDEAYYYQPVLTTKYTCNDCKIVFKQEDEKWMIPSNLLPTKKQINTIAFINSNLGMELSALTKRQCIRDIGRYFDKAKQAKEEYDRAGYNDEAYADICFEFEEEY